LEPFFSAFLELSLLYKTQLNIQNQKGGNDYGYKKTNEDPVNNANADWFSQLSFANGLGRSEVANPGRYQNNRGQWL
jgi:hypothetical protein